LTTRGERNGAPGEAGESPPEVPLLMLELWFLPQEPFIGLEHYTNVPNSPHVQPNTGPTNTQPLNQFAKFPILIESPVQKFNVMNVHSAFNNS
jgi:hypothetical protein